MVLYWTPTTAIIMVTLYLMQPVPQSNSSRTVHPLGEFEIVLPGDAGLMFYNNVQELVKELFL